MIDTTRLLAWLDDRKQSQAPVVHAMYAGLAERVRRGEFDRKEEDEGGERQAPVHDIPE